MSENHFKAPVKPAPLPSKRTPWHSEPVPPIPVIADDVAPDLASTTYSKYRTGLSNHRTGLSEHRTELSEHRTDLSEHRTALSEFRTDLSTERTEMSMRRTGMSFQRTRMSADRTLMSVIRTSLSLISFGFTIFQFFEKLKDTGTLGHAAAPRNFGSTLVVLGIALLAGGIVYHLQFMLGLRKTRHEMIGEQLVHGESIFPPSLTLITAALLLVIGVVAIISMVFDVGPFN